jgi:hypothetical protein
MEAHLQLGHLGYLRQEFFWPHKAKEVGKFIQSCPTCQRTKAPKKVPTGKMQTPSFPCQPFSDLAIDFVGPLQASRNYDMHMPTLWVHTNHFSGAEGQPKPDLTLTISLQKFLNHISQMRGKIASHMQCHLAFSK